MNTERKFWQLNVSYSMKNKTDIMKCKHVHKNFIEYIEHTLSEPLSTALHDHLDNCPECKMLFKNILNTYSVFNNLPKPEINPYFYTKIEQRLKSKNQDLSLSSFVLKRLQPVIASVIIILGIGLGILIGKGLASTNLINKDRTSILDAYASEYYLSGTNDDNMDAFNVND